MQPSVTDDCGGGGRLAPITLHNVLAADQNFADPLSVGAADSHFAIGNRSSTAQPTIAIDRRNARQSRGLGEPVCLEKRKSKVGEEFRRSGIEERPADSECPELA